MCHREAQSDRYADDFSIYCRTRPEAVKANYLVFKFLREKLKLPVNTDKSGIRRPVNLQVLGFGFVPTYRKGEKGKYQLVVTAKKFKSFKDKLKELTRKTTPMSFDERIERINSTIRGWLNYFRYASILQKLIKLGCIDDITFSKQNQVFIIAIVLFNAKKLFTPNT